MFLFDTIFSAYMLLLSVFLRIFFRFFNLESTSKVDFGLIGDKPCTCRVAGTSQSDSDSSTNNSSIYFNIFSLSEDIISSSKDISSKLSIVFQLTQ